MDETKINNIEGENEMKETTFVADVKTAWQKEKARRAAKREVKKQEREQARANASFWVRHKGELIAGAIGAAAGGAAGYWAANKDTYEPPVEDDILDIDPVEIDGVPVAETIE